MRASASLLTIEKMEVENYGIDQLARMMMAAIPSIDMRRHFPLFECLRYEIFTTDTADRYIGVF